MKLNPTTAKPMVEQDQDMATKQKLKAYEKFANKTNADLSKISNSKNKIAVIHIDGNGLEELIPKLIIPLSKFSQKLDSATKTAFKTANKDKNLRKIIVGGVVCNVNDALSFTKEFLENFENETKKIAGLSDGLSAYAGIAYCNKKYQFNKSIEKLEDFALNNDNLKSLNYHTLTREVSHKYNKEFYPFDGNDSKRAYCNEDNGVITVEKIDSHLK